MQIDEIEKAEEVNLEIAMRNLARAGALADERWGAETMRSHNYGRQLDAAHFSGAMWMQARAICNELGRDWEAVADGARRYAMGVVAGRTNVVN